MIHIEVDDIQSREKLLKNKSVSNTTWVVADLECKRYLQERLLESENWLPENAVLRASELWQKILLTQAPELRVVSRAFIQSLIQEWLEEQKIDWAHGPSGANTLIAYVEFFLPIIVHPQGIEVLEPWLRENNSAQIRWGKWLALSQKIYQELSKQKLILPRWIPAFLQSKLDTVRWPNNIIVELGPDLSALEFNLFSELAKQVEITVMAPDKYWLTRYNKVLWPYHLVSGKSLNTGDPNAVLPEKLNHIELCDFATRLSEVKTTVSRIRAWLDAGIQPQEICVFASDIENYWPVLNAYLQEEGIPSTKPTVGVLQSLPSICQWMAHLRTLMGQLTSSDLEASLFGPTVPLKIDYSTFRIIFSNLLSAEELERVEEVKRHSLHKVASQQLMSRDEFLLFILSYANEFVSFDAIQPVMSKFFLESTSQQNMHPRSWLDFLSGLIAQTEYIVQDGETEGVRVLRLESGQMFTASRTVIMGLTERSLYAAPRIQVTQADVIKLGEDLGFFLERPESSKSEFFADWITHSNVEQCVLTCSATDFDGQAEAPALFWLGHAVRQGKNPDAITPVSASRWDEIQSAEISHFERTKLLKPHIDQDLGRSTIPTFAPINRPSLSAHSLKNYMDCPFKFAAEKIFALKSEPEVDLDLDKLRAGRLLHHVLQTLIVSGDVSNYEDKRLIDVIEESRHEMKSEIFLSGVFWHRVRDEILDLAKKFIRFELEWRKKFPETKTAGCEIQIEGVWNDFPIRGSIDRVDLDKAGSCVVLDYKTQKSSEHRNHGAWIKNAELQLLFYIKAIECGWTKLQPNFVEGAFYYFIRDSNRRVGLMRKSGGGQLFELEKGSRAIISDEGYAALMQSFESLVGECQGHILEGQFSPRPSDLELCKTCDWRKLCRAPHLQ